MRTLCAVLLPYLPIPLAMATPFCKGRRIGLVHDPSLPRAAVVVAVAMSDPIQAHPSMK